MSTSVSVSSPSGSRPVIEPAGRMLQPQQSRMDSIPSFRNARDFEKLKAERERLKTFALPPGWPVTFIPPEDCAKAGFFFLQDGDKVQCAFCRGVAGEWEQGDNPAAEHRRHFPRCPFVCNLPVGNVPIGHEVEESSSSRERELAGGVDICGPFLPPAAARMIGEDAAVRGAQPLDGSMNDVATSLAIQVCGNGPMHKNLVTFEARIQSFGSSWPASTGQCPKRMAEAGFAYLGHLDHVKCFYCDGGLRNWEPSDDPWLEHARWFPHCSFLLLNKGDSFVKEVAKSKPAVVPPQFASKPPSIPLTSPRRVSDQEIRDLIDTPIVQAALEMGMELTKVKGALQRKIQQTGQPFLTTEALLDAVLRRDPEYESDPESDEGEDNDEDEVTTRRRPPQLQLKPLTQMNISLYNGAGSASTSEAGSSSSGEHSSGSDEESPTTSSPPRSSKSPASRSPSGDSGVSAGSSEHGEEQEQRRSATTPTSSEEPSSSGTSRNGDSDTESKEKEGETTNKEKEIVKIKEEPEVNPEPSSSPPETEGKKALKLEEELRKLREQTQCKICMDNKVEVVFLPCGHLVSCTRCATALSSCAVCRQPIKAFVKTYLS